MTAKATDFLFRVASVNLTIVARSKSRNHLIQRERARIRESDGKRMKVLHSRVTGEHEIRGSELEFHISQKSIAISMS